MAGRSLLAVLALVCQLAAGAVVRPDPVARGVIAGLDPAHIICFAGHGDRPSDSPPAHHSADCALCPLCLTPGAPGALLAQPPALPLRRVLAVLPVWTRPPAHAPPAHVAAAAYPRGPPIPA